ncbi:MAG TPA: kynureninase [Bacteroidia bacterium]|nr:kynureninase [Bacteroidia bacterium]
MTFENTKAFADECDHNDSLSTFRNLFHFPKINGRDSIYFCGNSLGLQPKKTEEFIGEELEDWKNLGVEGHMHARHPWFPYHEFLRNSTAKITGALPHEVVVMNSLTANLHFMMVSFYRPNNKRYKILFEHGPFSSDRYAFETQAKFHAHRNGSTLFDPEKALIELKPRDGEVSHRTEDIIKTIEENADELALVLIGGVNYYTGQLFDMKRITEAAHKAGAIAGFDLAHATGNVELKLHEWDVDFAAWCSYKYLNAGPGAVGGAFVHERHSENADLPRFAGWWGNDPDTRFTMPTQFIPKKGADGWQVSNAPVFSMAALRASMDLFEEAGMKNLVEKSKLLTGYLAFIIEDINKQCEGINHIQIITPENSRGCQLSTVISKNGKAIHNFLGEHGVIADWRHPDVIRVAPVPMYNSFDDVFQFGQLLYKAIIANK